MKADASVVGHIVLVYEVITLLNELDLFGIRSDRVCTNHRLTKVSKDRRAPGGINTLQLTGRCNVYALSKGGNNMEVEHEQLS